MTDPVICNDGHSYQRSAIERYLENGSRASPLNPSIQLDPQVMIPNVQLRGLALEFIRGSKQAKADDQDKPWFASIGKPCKLPSWFHYAVVEMWERLDNDGKEEEFYAKHDSGFDQYETFQEWLEKHDVGGLYFTLLQVDFNNDEEKVVEALRSLWGKYKIPIKPDESKA
jgi:hypothetical protein